MRIRTAAAALLVYAALAPGSGRTASSGLETAALAWDAGDYVTALTTYLQILDSAESDNASEAIALQTGELFIAREIDNDGEAPQFSPDGRHLVYETGAWPQRITRV